MTVHLGPLAFIAYLENKGGCLFFRQKFRLLRFGCRGLAEKANKPAAGMVYRHDEFAVSGPGLGNIHILRFGGKTAVGGIPGAFPGVGHLVGVHLKGQTVALFAFVREEEKRKLYSITELGKKILELEIQRIERLYRNSKEEV